MSSKILGQQDLLEFLISRFQSGSVRFLLTGSLAVAYYGFPRATHDIDFVVVMEASAIKALRKAVSRFGKDFLQDTKTLAEEIGFASLYSLYHLDTGIKVDLWLEKAADFRRIWDRRRTMMLGGKPVSLVSPEDLILTKLAWCKEVWSDRHFRDCIGMSQVQKGKLDEVYCAKRVRELGLETLWENMKKGMY